MKKIFGWSWEQLLLAVAGMFIFAVGINLFLVPAGLYNGGFLGLSQIIRTLLVDNLNIHFARIDIAGIIYYVFNIPLFLLAFFRMGKRFFLKTMICVSLQTLFLTIIPSPSSPIVEETITSALIAGIVAGGGLGLALISGAAGGGLDILSVYLTKKRNSFSVGKLSLGMNLIVYLLCAIMFDISIVIYSIIYTTFLSLIIDRVHMQNICSEVMIFTKKDALPIIKHITEHISRDATFWQATGGYTKEDTTIIYTITSKYELQELQHFLKNYDAHSFLVKKHGVLVDGHFEKKLQ